ncbi:MAG: translation initiation factor 2 [Actinocatenispora sp.]
MTNADRPTEPQDDGADSYWRRPVDGGPGAHGGPVAQPPVGPRPEPYVGPPPTVPPPSPHWRPPVVVPTSPPRTMPAQDHGRLDAEERAARTVSHGIGLVAGAVVLVLLITVCARLIG